jgi:hypothetical protein
MWNAETAYDLWDLASRRLIGLFEDRREAVEVVQAYVDADEATEVVLIQCDDARSENRSLTGGELIAWLERARADMQHTA